jgi:hypothetical protein
LAVLLFQQRPQLVFAVDLSFLRCFGCPIELDLAAVIRVREVTLRIDFAGRFCGIGRAAAFLVAALLVLTLVRGVLQPANGPHLLSDKAAFVRPGGHMERPLPFFLKLAVDPTDRDRGPIPATKACASRRVSPVVRWLSS